MRKNKPPRVEVADFKKDSRRSNSSTRKPIHSSLYETRSMLNAVSLPILWVLTLYVMSKKTLWKLFGGGSPRINTLWVDGLGKSARQIKENAASWKALDIIYNYEFGRSKLPKVLIDDWWFKINNCKAVRNRYKLVKQKIRETVLKFSGNGEVRLLSLACGSAQPVIETLSELKKEGVAVKVVLLDIDRDALYYASRLAEECQVAEQLQTVRGSVSQVARISRDFKPHIVEMLGLLDYLPEDKAVKLSGRIRQSLEPEGVFIFCNIAPNVERHFLRWVINWPMIYRTDGQLCEITESAGFSDFRIVYEPLRIHGLVVAENNGSLPTRFAKSVRSGVKK